MLQQTLRPNGAREPRTTRPRPLRTFDAGLAVGINRETVRRWTADAGNHRGGRPEAPAQSDRVALLRRRLTELDALLP